MGRNAMLALALIAAAMISCAGEGERGPAESDTGAGGRPQASVAAEIMPLPPAAAAQMGKPTIGAATASRVEPPQAAARDARTH